mgnify:CR=1 FL=1
MGQAKQRGTFEQRRVESIEREEAREQRYAAELAARQEAQRRTNAARALSARTAPTRFQRHHSANLYLATAAALAVALNGEGNARGR